VGSVGLRAGLLDDRGLQGLRVKVEFEVRGTGPVPLAKQRAKYVLLAREHRRHALGDLDARRRLEVHPHRGVLGGVGPLQ